MEVMARSRALKDALVPSSVKPKSRKQLFKEMYASGKEDMAYGQETMIKGEMKMMGAKMMMKQIE